MCRIERAVWFLMLVLPGLGLKMNVLPPTIAVVTGSNKGIGKEVAIKLASTPNTICIVAARDMNRGQQAAQEVNIAGQTAGGGGAVFKQLDIADNTSVQRFMQEMQSEYGRLDVLVNNAAIAFKGADPTPFQYQAAPTLRTNFWATVQVTDALLPLLRQSPAARIVNVASMSGHLRILSHERQDIFSSSSLTRPVLYDLMRAFEADVQAGVHHQNGWPSTCYGMSKLGVIAFTKILAREEPGMVVNCCCPGGCRTDMSSGSGSKTAEEGARTPYLLTQMPPGTKSGGFWSGEREIVW
uniref:Uncharacterized protein n=1 Tax=Fibrocapsa japonica TaxID=94617 RepID=A0A7S2UVT3_9STRA|mmetsp:Transcript_11219/g.16532  ORF Transcript_11219/g.16532 Transcript_11219/m.16532 type:complete len:297 (+) Transcript_11219:205-1095(+)|eukprot:CAMPEP_0113936710 /NCGR_PEP_ID=MMETSP1339-20121228/3535_1 /TAXON_ID=94617 /ORGANISM="Fibrocapsa japonica" /LENGTH=296 /DNA_ID=CAMNT_0000939245 /DNA_START=146 /DNA_END=1036 /DNA_ORIENTATION=+ /assembly_acc=CAM_ASM_000762